ncbi:hypothetical protein LCGC14_2306020, partial [marine sediment metagenome]
RHYVEGIRELLAEAGAADAVEFLGHLDGPSRHKFLASLSVMSVPTRAPEALGMYILEAWASGVPVVQPAHGAFVELIDAAGGGVLVAPNDPGALADALAELLSDTERARAMGRAGRQAVQEQFNVDNMARGVADVCRRVAGR